MARVYPFRALRYNPSKVRIEDVVTQPYDKITPAMQQAYYARSPYNLVRIILGLPELFDTEQENVYSRAARDLSEWRSKDVLFEESEPAIFAYSQRFVVPGTSDVRERRGLIALGTLYDYEQGVVFRHEQTLSKPKSDRMNLLRATRAHFGQIFMLYSDPGQSVDKLLFNDRTAPDVEVTDEYGVVHQLWKVNEPSIINMVTSEMDDKKLIIADGHHRYETALAYSKEYTATAPAAERRQPSPAGPPSSEVVVMMTFVNMDAGGLAILPTHRVVHGLVSFDLSAFLKSAAQFFTITPLPDQGDAAALTQHLTGGGTRMIAVAAGGCFLLEARKDVADKFLSDVSERQRQLDVVQLHRLVLEHLLGISRDAIRDQTNLRYLRDAAEAMGQVSSGEAQIAFLINPVTLEQLRSNAFAGETLPQKSTDFYPKLLSGLTIYALD